MDERETVPRREAIVGLSLLGILSLMLTGTLGYRIVYPVKHVPTKVVLNEWKSQAPLPDDASGRYGPDSDEHRFATANLPTADPIPTIADASPNISASAVRDATPAPDVETPPATRAPHTAPAPTFVSPSYR